MSSKDLQVRCLSENHSMERLEALKNACKAIQEITNSFESQGTFDYDLPEESIDKLLDYVENQPDFRMDDDLVEAMATRKRRRNTTNATNVILEPFTPDEKDDIEKRSVDQFEEALKLRIAKKEELLDEAESVLLVDMDVKELESLKTSIKNTLKRKRGGEIQLQETEAKHKKVE